jgi:hypothetical protein
MYFCFLEDNCCPLRQTEIDQKQTLIPRSERSGFHAVKSSRRRTMGSSTEWRLIWDTLVEAEGIASGETGSSFAWINTQYGEPDPNAELHGAAIKDAPRAEMVLHLTNSRDRSSGS